MNLSLDCRTVILYSSLCSYAPLSVSFVSTFVGFANPRPSSVYSLACGCFLLFTGQMADVLGSRKVFLSGCILYATFTLLSGLSQTPLQLISFRAMQGLSIAACLPSAVGILSLSFPTGSTRNIGFAILGAGQPVGFASGMVLSGVFISKLSWRWAFYCSAIVNLGVFAAAWWGLPRTKVFEPVSLRTFWRRVDWIGAGLVSSSLGLFFYVLAYVLFPMTFFPSFASTDIFPLSKGQLESPFLLRNPLWSCYLMSLHVSEILTNRIVADSPAKWVAPVPIILTVISVVLFPAFLLWERRQETLQKTCIMPLMVWKNKSFAAVCAAVFMAWAAFNGVQYFAALTYLHQAPSPNFVSSLMDVATSDPVPVISHILIIPPQYSLSSPSLSLVSCSWSEGLASKRCNIAQRQLHPSILFPVSSPEQRQTLPQASLSRA